MSPQDGMDVNPQPPAPEASTSSVAIAGDSGYGNPPIASKLHPIPAMGPTSLTQICVSLLAESASDTEEETGATDASAGT